MKSKFFMVGNAHLDPVWQWDWQEGSAAAKATIRSALDRLNEYKEFVFVCSSVSVYEWIEEFDPDMFEEIKQMVKGGRWILTGGMYVQPDCNIPSGEGLVRQTLYAQNWFYKKFGKTAKVGYNVDSFGHNGMLPQIYKKSGMDNYVFMRPGKNESTLPYNLFNWVSSDGSEVMAYRIPDAYCDNYKDMEQLTEGLKKSSDDIPNNFDLAFRFYGVGNHGGGPTKKNIELILQYKKENPQKEIVFSNLSDLFENVKNSGVELPKYSGDLQYHATGCYSTLTSIKNAIRRCESELLAGEIFSMQASGFVDKKYPAKSLDDGWKDLLFLHFHDVAGGCCVRDAYTDMFNFAGEARAIASRHTNNALQTISWKIDTSDSKKGTPFVIFNPYPWRYKGTVTLNEQANLIADSKGNEVVYQWVESPKKCCWDTKNVLVEVDIPPLGYATYFMNLFRPRMDLNYAECEAPKEFKSTVSAKENCLENEYLKVTFSKDTGFITSFYDKEKQIEWLSGDGAKAAVMNDFNDSWGHNVETYHDYDGCFTEPTVSVIENGPLRATIRVKSRYGNSKLTQDFSLLKGEKIMSVFGYCDWREQHKLLKIQYPIAANNPKAYYEIPFGVIEKECNAHEESGQRWIAMGSENGRIALINDRFYGFSFDNNIMEQTVLRSCAYCDHGIAPELEKEYIDQGEHYFNYQVMPVDTYGWNSVIKRATQLNFAPKVIVENNHKGTLPLTSDGLLSSIDGVIISAFKRAKNNNGTILRAYETDGKNQTATFSGPLLRKELSAEFSPYCVKTFFLEDGKDNWKEVLLTEFDF